MTQASRKIVAYVLLQTLSMIASQTHEQFYQLIKVENCSMGGTVSLVRKASWDSYIGVHQHVVELHP